MSKRSNNLSTSSRHEWGPRRAGAASDGPRAGAAAVLLAISICAVYVPALDVPLIFDDDLAIVRNKSIISLWPLVGTKEHPGPLNPAPDVPTCARPLVNLSLAVNYYFGGVNPIGYHAFNVVLHFLSAMLVWAILRRCIRLPYFAGRFETSAGWLALAVALVWAMHPLQTEAVIYATQRTELMMALFYLATLYCSLRYWATLRLPLGEDRGERELPQIKTPSPTPLPKKGAVETDSNRSRRATWLVLAFLACLSGMASKEVMVSAPLMALLFERTFVAGSLAKALSRSWPLYAGLVCTWALVLALSLSAPRSASAGFQFGLPPQIWWFTQSKIFLMYLTLVVWPWPLLIHYQLPYLSTFAEAWIYVVPVLLLGILILVLLWRNHPLGFLGTWVIAILSPTLVVPILTEMAAERRMYLPLAALVVLFVVGGYLLVQWVPPRRVSDRQAVLGFGFPMVAIGLPALLIALVFGLVSAKRLAAYGNELDLWQEVLRFQPENHVAHQNAGFYLDKAGNVSDAIEHYREAIRLSPDSAQAHYSLGLMLTKIGASEEAATHFAEASRIVPKDVTMRNNLAVALSMAGRNDEAIDAFRATLELDPNNWSARSNMGVALQKAGKYRESIESLQQALLLNPKALDIYNDLANTYALMNQREKAIATLEHALKLARSSGDVENAEKFNTRLIENR